MYRDIVRTTFVRLAASWVENYWGNENIIRSKGGDLEIYSNGFCVNESRSIVYGGKFIIPFQA